MTIAETTTAARNDYTGDGSTTAFSFTFVVLAEANQALNRDYTLKVILTEGDVEEIQQEGTDYTVTLNDNGLGTVTFTTAPTATQSITFLSDIPRTQSTDYINIGTDKFPADSHEATVDKLTLITRELDEKTSRSILLTESSNLTDITIPVSSDNANKAIVVNSAGNNLTAKNLADIGTAPVTDFAKTILDDTTAAEARTTLDVYSQSETDALLPTQATTTALGSTLLPKPITITNNSTDAEHDMDFGAGVMNFDDGSGQAATNALTKQFDATFALGNNAGGMVSGESLPTDNLVYMFAISTADGTLTDIIGTTTRDGSTISGDSVVSSNNLTKKEYLGAFYTDASDNILAGQYFVNKSGYRFQYKDYILVDTSGYTSRTAIDMRVPPNAVVNFLASAGSSNSTLTYTLYTNLNDTDSTPSLNNCNIVTNVNFAGFGQFFEITNDNGEIGKRSNNTLTSSNNTRTKGWEEKY